MNIRPIIVARFRKVQFHSALFAFFLCAGGLSAQNARVFIGDNGDANYQLPGEDPSMNVHVSYMSQALYFQSSDGPHSGDTGLHSSVNPGSDGYYGAHLQAQSSFSTSITYGSTSLSAFGYTSTGLNQSGGPGARQDTVVAQASADSTWQDQFRFYNALLPAGADLLVQISLSLNSNVAPTGIAAYSTTGAAQFSWYGENGQGYLPGLSLSAPATSGQSSQTTTVDVVVQNGVIYDAVDDSSVYANSHNNNYSVASGQAETGSVRIDVSSQFAITMLTPDTTYSTGSGVFYPTDIAAVPEPATWFACLLTAGAILGSIWRRDAKRSLHKSA